MPGELSPQWLFLQNFLLRVGMKSIKIFTGYSKESCTARKSLDLICGERENAVQ